MFMFGLVLKAQTVEEIKEELRDTIALYIVAVAEERGVNPIHALNVANCESGLNHLAVGDKGLSLGLWQIHQPAHPNTREIALDPIASTQWAMDQLVSGRWEMWSCYKIVT